jgi:hypothetical protein
MHPFTLILFEIGVDLRREACGGGFRIHELARMGRDIISTGERTAREA